MDDAAEDRDGIIIVTVGVTWDGTALPEKSIASSDADGGRDPRNRYLAQ